MRYLRAIVCALTALTALVPVGCESAPSMAAGLQSDNPAERIEACIGAARRRDSSTLPLLVERLEDPASDVRFFAIAALKRMTGQTFGYRYFDKEPERRTAVRRWRQWLKAEAVSKRGG